jgi:putative lumazine-binding protein
MSTVTAGNETAVGAVQLYVDGVRTGDAAKLEQGFYDGAWMFGAVAGERLDMPISEMIKLIADKPADVDGSFHATVRSVEEEGDAAVVVLEEEGFWGALSFVDFFSLARIGGQWKIVNKTFAHTGGSLPAA